MTGKPGEGEGGVLGAEGLFRKKGKRSASRRIYIQLAVTEDVAEWTLALSENTTAVVLQLEPESSRLCKALQQLKPVWRTKAYALI